MRATRWYGRAYCAAILAWVVGFFGSVLYGLPIEAAIPLILPAYGFLFMERFVK